MIFSDVNEKNESDLGIMVSLQTIGSTLYLATCIGAYIIIHC